MVKKNTKAPAIPAVQGTLELPYEAINITNIVGRIAIREMAAEKKASYGRQTYYIEHKIIHPRPGFNCRIKPDGMSEEAWENELEIPAFALDILKNGLGTPLEGDLIQEAKGKKSFLLTAGERRWRAIGWLIRNGHKLQANGKPMSQVEVLFNGREITEEQRIARMVTTDSNLKYKPIELGHAFLRLKTICGKTHEQIAQEYGKSRQTVDNFVKLAQEPQSIQDAMILGKLTTTAAIELINTEKDPKRREEIVAGSVASDQKLKVKDIGEAAKYKKWYELFAAEVGKYNDEVMTYEGAVLQCKEIGAKATAALPDEKNDIEEGLANTLEVLLNNKAIRDADKKEVKHGEGRKPTAPKSNVMIPWKGAMIQILDEYRHDKKTYGEAIEGIANIEYEARDRNHEVHEAAITEDVNNSLETIEELKKLKETKPFKTETQQANKVELESHKTPATTPTQKPRTGNDALEPIDFTKDKELGEFELNEAMKLLDKLKVKLDLFPKNLQQYINDCAGLATIAQQKITAAIEVIKKAPNRGE